MSIEIKVTPTGLLEVNTVIIHTENHEAMLIDPGGNEDYLFKYLTDNNLALKCIVHTHGHFDHISGTARLLEKHPELKDSVRICLHKSDLPLWQNLETQAGKFGIPLFPQTTEITDWLEENTTIGIKGFEFKVLHTPGHSPGSVSLYNESMNLLVSGDVIFQGSIGRTDLWQGNFDQLIQSIQSKIMTLPANTRIIAGHGPDTTVGQERTSNPFLTA